MTSKIHFKIVSPERLLFAEDVDMVVIPGEQGDFGVLPTHAPLISTLRSGLVTIYNQNEIKGRVYVSHGFAHVTETDCTVMAEDSIFLEEMNEEMLEMTILQAKKELEEARTEDEKFILKKDLTYIYTKLDLIRRLKR